MQLNFAFRLSLYTTLALASLCLGYAELPFLPEMSLLSLLVLMLLVVAYFFEGKWSLSIPAANVAGGVIAALLGAWFAYQFLRPSGSLLETLPWPTSLLPFLGPVMMVVMTAKMFRPKHIGDFWAMQGIGLTLVALGCALATDAVFAILFILYLVSGVWSLTLFYLYRETHRHPGHAITHLTKPMSDEPLPFASEVILEPSFVFRSRAPWIGSAVRWVLAIAGGSLILFLITPRSPSSPWELTMSGKGRFEVGYSNDNTIDLTRSGTLGINHELAFEITAQDAKGEPKTDLDENMRFRGRTVHLYEKGTWRFEKQNNTIRVIDQTIRPNQPPSDQPRKHMQPFTLTAELPDFGPHQYFLTFKLSTKVAGEVLADPVVWFPRRPAPILTISTRQTLPWMQMNDSSFTPLDLSAIGNAPYKQVLLPLPEANIGPPMRLEPGSIESLRLPVPKGIQQFTNRLIERFVREGKLPREGSELDQTQLRPRASHERIARLLTDYLTDSGEFTYSLKITRGDSDLDPIEDFLINVKSGHCNRYASALTLMLRSQGIPARMVLGFRGCQPVGEGKYQVFQHHAHAWVEALIEREAPGGQGRVWHWMSLDGTPNEEATASEGSLIERWFGSTQSGGDSLFRDFIVGYTAERQQKAGSALWNGVLEWFSDATEFMRTNGIAFLFFGGIAFAFGSLIILIRRRKNAGEDVATSAMLSPIVFHRRLMEMLKRAGYSPNPGQTTREFAVQIQSALRDRFGDAERAGIPLDVTTAYYRVRFGEHVLSDPELQELDSRLNALESALSESRNVS